LPDSDLLVVVRGKRNRFVDVRKVGRVEATAESALPLQRKA